MRISQPEKRLERFWGQVDRKHVGIIQRWVNGSRVLDMGCGYGTTTAHLAKAGIDCTGIDYDPTAVAEAQRRFPNARYLNANAEELPFPDASFDVIVMRDALHHLYREADFAKVRGEVLRVASPRARLIVFDPNVNLILRTMRRIAAHKDEERDFETARASFNTLFTLPLSGGYVGLERVPNIRWAHSVLIGAENQMERAVNAVRLGRRLCWRYVLVGDRTPA